MQKERFGAIEAILGELEIIAMAAVNALVAQFTIIDKRGVGTISGTPGPVAVEAILAITRSGAADLR